MNQKPNGITVATPNARRLLARIYFELKENTALNSLIESAKIYLHRQKSIGYHREMYINFFKILELLLKTDLKNRAILRGQIEAAQYLAEREWLLEKLQILPKSGIFSSFYVLNSCVLNSESTFVLNRID